MSAIEVDQDQLPSAVSAWFVGQESIFPSPQDVRTASDLDHSAALEAYRPRPVKFPELGLLVKWGSAITVAEGQCLWFLQRNFGDDLPVPSIFGWRRDAGQTFLYMQLVHGDTLANRWESLNHEERKAVCFQLRRAVECWRRIRARTSIQSLSQIGGQPLTDIMFQDSGIEGAGPFADAGSFHLSFSRLTSRSDPESVDPSEIPELSGFDNENDVTFTHGDLDKSNILISKAEDGPPRLLSIIDWHQAGWYPAPWEYCKAQCLDSPSSAWVREYLPIFLPSVEFEYLVAFEYVSMACI